MSYTLKATEELNIAIMEVYVRMKKEGKYPKDYPPNVYHPNFGHLIVNRLPAEGLKRFVKWYRNHGLSS